MIRLGMDSPARTLVMVTKKLRQVFEAQLAQSGGSLATWIVLRNLAEEADIIQRGLAERMQIQGPTLTRHLDRLEAEGLVRRTRDATDRRAIRIAMTPAGRRLFARLSGAAEEVQSLALRGLADRDVSTFVRILGRIRSNLEEGTRDAATA